MSAEQRTSNPPGRCEALTVLYARRCRSKATGRANGMAVCALHKRRIEKTFVDAEKRWKDAGEPESDL